jgi:hypothetical protein
MTDSPEHPPLKALHLASSLTATKLAGMERLSTDALCASLLPGSQACLKTRADGTILDGHHRIHILRQRGVDVDSLPREIVAKDQD